MIQLQQGDIYGKPSSDSPYQMLYIYYLQGRAGRLQEEFGTNFIGNWEEGDFSFLFFTQPSDAVVNAYLHRRPDLKFLDYFRMTYEEWHGGTVSPFRTKKFYIVPEWENSKTDDTRIKIVLNPGVVFGTGYHPTTHDCLEFIEHVNEVAEIRTVLDLGAGTGLLALAAARLGAERVLAVDINFLASQTTKKNIALNHLDDRVIAVQGKAETFIDYPVDLLIANIHYDVMKDILDAERFLDHKWFILSGLLRTQAKAVSEKLSRKPFKIIDTREHEGVWYTFFGKIEKHR